MAAPAETRITGAESGFTLIELSIVLVIIGLIVGGVLVGQNLIAAAAVRAQITQIEKYNTAVNTFRGKYGGIPGDLQFSLANQFGFNVSGCDGSYTNRDGNGLIDGYPGFVLGQSFHETGLFWIDLANANLIDGTYPNGGLIMNGCYGIGTTLSLTPGAAYVGDLLPAAKIGGGNFLYVYDNAGSNWFGVSAVTGINNYQQIVGGSGLTVAQAYAIDKKIDDGIPTSGNVVAVYLNGSTTNTVPALNAAASGGASWSCYDTVSNTYSITQNGGAGLNCVLSFRFQ